MVNEYKKIVLLTGLMGISDHDFKMVKSLLSKELKLNRKMQDDYDRIRIADLMEEKFPKDAGMHQLIELYKEMPGLGDLADKLKKVKAKAKRKETEKSNIPARRRKRDEPSSSQPMSTTNEDLEPESGRSTLNSQVPRFSTTASKRDQESQVSPEISLRVQARQMSLATASSSTQAPGMSPATRSSSAHLPGVSLTTASSSAQVPGASLTTAFSSAQTTGMSPATVSSSFQGPRVSAAKAFSSAQAPKRMFLARPAKKPRLKTVPTQPSEVHGYHHDPKQVMVLKATEPFTYSTKSEKSMFHATVATETEFFRVKVFDISLKAKFIKSNVITISDYFGCNGFINIYSASSVSEVNVNQSMIISTALMQRANATPKINYLCSKRRGIFVNGIFMVYEVIKARN
ncbi:pyrin and HIN domain-containing protein 1-like isoform X2 [Cricetulus griseus]|uniref:Pyrin and HIN domain-containing protein 1-like isoform X2 n=1 Tax=Cricetulus griseus TaxID=10029 RepID=A0A9J7H3G3_CRIGR|nr:pyrin and HIN domain-containing protein 1-like isoform X2 [Cricetulus griseus]XP_035310312.1 pyrin and HIN domain-containing protein 1-like isoform X2 [Cricetulus griseus]